MRKRKKKRNPVKDGSLGNFFALGSEDSIKEMSKEDETLFTDEQIDRRQAASETLSWISGESAVESSETNRKHTEPTDALDMLKEIF